LRKRIADNETDQRTSRRTRSSGPSAEPKKASPRVVLNLEFPESQENRQDLDINDQEGGKIYKNGEEDGLGGNEPVHPKVSKTEVPRPELKEVNPRNRRPLTSKWFASESGSSSKSTSVREHTADPQIKRWRYLRDK
jgi:hypothetical protein